MYFSAREAPIFLLCAVLILALPSPLAHAGTVEDDSVGTSSAVSVELSALSLVRTWGIGAVTASQRLTVGPIDAAVTLEETWWLYSGRRDVERDLRLRIGTTLDGDAKIDVAAVYRRNALLDGPLLERADGNALGGRLSVETEAVDVSVEATPVRFGADDRFPPLVTYRVEVFGTTDWFLRVEGEVQSVDEAGVVVAAGVERWLADLAVVAGRWLPAVGPGVEGVGVRLAVSRSR